MKILSAFSIAIGFSFFTALAENSHHGAIAALQALPPHFADQVVRVSADNGRPNPAIVPCWQEIRAKPASLRKIPFTASRL